MGDSSPDRKPSGCGLLNAVLGRGSLWSRRAASTGSLSTASGNAARSPSTLNLRRRRGGSDQTAFLDRSCNGSEGPQKPNMRPSPGHQQKVQHGRTMSNVVPIPAGARAEASQGYVSQGKRVPKEAVGISGELEQMIIDHQNAKESSNLVRASSGNVMLYGHLGNLRQPAGNSNPSTLSDRHPKPAKDDVPMHNRSTSAQAPAASLCRAISTRMDPEQLKIMGNEDYKNGRYAEALALYDAAISIDPSKASYRSNKSAALTALGRLLDAVFECREAVRIEPHYHRAHNRMATLYLRLGEVEKAMYHSKHAGPDADPDVIAKAKVVQGHLHKCTEARRLRDWNSLIRESEHIFSSGADSAPQIFALQAEAFLKLHRHQEAVDTISRGPNFEADACTKFLGPIGSSSLLTITAQVDMAAGRFDDALEAAERATRLDPNNKEAKIVLRRACAVAAARSKGNELFRTSRYTEAAAAYGEGLEHDPYNSVLLCNRAACRSKLGQFEKAIEDCNVALNVRPPYTKARLRRADCNAKLGRWEASIQDYEMLIRETPDNEEVSRAFSEAKLQLKTQQGGDIRDMKNDQENMINVLSINVFRKYTTSQAISVVYFYNKPGERQTLQIMDQLCKRYPSVNFLKVVVEDNPSIAKSEGVSSLPSFIIYKNSSMVQEIIGDDHDSLESSIDDLMS